MSETYAGSLTLATYLAPASPAPLQSTITALDDILTDFIIETCHYAALSASYSRRQKIKVEDFKWVLRKDERMLGKALESLWREKRIRDDRKMAGFEDLAGEGAGKGMQDLEGLAEVGGVKGKDLKDRGKRRGRKKKVREARSAAS